jgi:hypothetical protein
MTTTVIMHTGVMQLRGQRPSIREGFRLAWRNVGRIAALAVFAGVFIGLTKRFTSALRAIPFVGRIARGAILSALTGLLYLALPVVVYERNGVVSSLRSTWTQLRKTWGGLVVGTGLMMSALWMGLWVVEFAVKTAFEAMTPVRVIDWSTMLILQVFAAVTLYALNVALSANLRAALYLHVTEGHTGILPEKALVGTMPAPRQTPLQVASAQVATAPRLTTFEIVRRP